MNDKTKKLFEASKEYSIWEKFPIVYRMLKSWRKGLYKPSMKNRIIILLSFIYVVSPVDLFPEAIFQFLGLADDLAVIMLLFSKLGEEIDSYVFWEKSNPKKEFQDAEVVSED